MRLPVSQLGDLLLKTVQQLRDGQCALAKDGVQITFVDDELTIAVELVPDDGWNKIIRNATSDEGEQTTTENLPSRVEESVQEASESKTVEEAAIIRKTETRKSGPSTSTQVHDAVRRTSSKNEEPTTISEKSVHVVDVNGRRVNNGGDVVETDYEVEAS